MRIREYERSRFELDEHARKKRRELEEVGRELAQHQRRGMLGHWVLTLIGAEPPGPNGPDSDD